MPWPCEKCGKIVVAKQTSQSVWELNKYCVWCEADIEDAGLDAIAYRVGTAIGIAFVVVAVAILASVI